MAAQAHTFRGYVVRERLGSDGPVRCYLCYDPSRGRDVLLQAFELIAPDARETFIRESRLRIELSHLNLLESVDAWIDGEVACAVFQVDFDETIAEVMDRGPRPSVAVIFRLIRDVCRGLGHARAHGITHLDISPANLWVRREVWTVRIGGLQLPAAADLLPESTAERARLDYLSPEQRAGDDGDERSDVFRAGLVLYELLSDRQLLLQTIGALGRKRAPAPLPSVANLRNLNFDVVLAQALAADPAERFPDLATFEHELNRLVWRILELLRESASTSPVDTNTTAPGLVRTELSESPPATIANNKAFDERVQFTVYKPKSVLPDRWHPLLVFAHLGEARVDAPADDPDPIEEVQRQAQSVLGDVSAYEDRTADSLHPVPTEGELLLVPYAEGIEFNPPKRAFFWTESVHREEFRFRAGRALDGRMVHGRLSIYLGAIILAEIGLTMKVESRVSPTPDHPVVVRPYRKVFASYSHRDREIVEEFSQYARAIGDQYLQDVIDLRSGELWQSSLESLIKDADVFQLFWSWNALESPAVREEWQFALGLARPWFIRPVYWDDPLPSQGDLPPQALLSLHFQRVRPKGLARPADESPLSVGPARDTYVPATPPKALPETPLLPTPLPDARLEITDALGRRIVPIAKSPFHIGRRETNDLRLAGNEVSREHAQITIDGNRFTLHDRNTRYGTYVNGEQVIERVLVHGDRVRLGRNGGVEMVFLLADTQAPIDPATTTAIGDLRQVAALLDGLRALGSGRVVDDVLSQVLDSAIDLTGAERGFIMLAPESLDLEVKMARGRGRTTLSGGSFATSRKVPEEVFRTGEPRIVADLLDGDLANTHMGTVALGIRNVLCVPLRLVRYVDKAENVGEERRIGVLYLDSRAKGSLLSGSTRAALETLATDAAVAIESAWLYRETMEKARMEQEIQIAAGIQQSLLPKAARAGSYFRAAAASLPCRSIGGDFYDYVDMADGSLGFALGGVAGKGPPAALLSAMMQGLFAAQAATNDEPAQTIARVNLALYRRGLESRFVTLVYGVLDAAGNLVYCNAGHNPPLVIGAAGVRRLERGGPIVGMFEAATYEDERLTLAAGDWLIVFSDGISGAMSASDDEYGEARIIDCIQRNKSLDPSGLLEALFSDVRDFARGAAQNDDITAMVLRYLGSE